MRRRLIILLSVLGLLGSTAVATSAAGAAGPAGVVGRVAKDAPEPDGEATITVRGGTTIVQVEGAEAGAPLTLVDRKGKIVAQGEADALGSKIFYDVKPGKGYTVQVETEDEVLASKAVEVLSKSHKPDTELYTSQKLDEGLNYIETRDGTLIAATVRLPAGKTLADGPFPTLVEYSGYDPANPNPLLDPSLLLGGDGGDGSPASDYPDFNAQLVANLVGFATVGVNMRGSGCSGGALDLFGAGTVADGYDVIETVAAQSWVKNNKVGMEGISFPGISQLFVASSRPPSLAAITPLSVYANPYSAPGIPGGIFNDGFFQEWLEERKHDSIPITDTSKDEGQPWARARIDAGDETCKANQALHGQVQVDPVEFLKENPYYNPGLMNQRSPERLVSKIDVPVLLSGMWQDEQTGSHFATMLDEFEDNPNVHFYLSNGVHADSLLNTAILPKVIEFWYLYVAEEAPTIDAATLALVPTAYSAILKAEGVTLPAEPFGPSVPYEQAKKEFEDSPRVTIYLESGAGTTGPIGAPVPEWEVTFDTWPPKEAEAQRWYFGPDGALTSSKPKGKGGEDTFQPDPSARPRASLPGDDQTGPWAALPAYEWAPVTDDTGLAYVTEPLDQDTVMAGTGSVDLWLESTAKDTDLQVTLTEVRPDGQEMLVQSGWIRASHRKLDTKRSTELEPISTHRKKDAKPLPAGEFSKVRVQIMPFAHAFREGSRIRLVISAPGGDRARWTFDTPETNGEVTDTIARTAKMPSSVALPVVSGVEVETALPPCPSLRGQPCRAYVPAGNGG